MTAIATKIMLNAVKMENTQELKEQKNEKNDEKKNEEIVNADNVILKHSSEQNSQSSIPMKDFEKLFNQKNGVYFKLDKANMNDAFNEAIEHCLNMKN